MNYSPLPWLHSPYTLLILKPKRVHQLPLNVRTAECLVIFKLQTHQLRRHRWCARGCVLLWQREHNFKKHVSVVKKQKRPHQFFWGTMLLSFRKCCFFYFFPFILPKEQLRKRQQVDVLLGQKWMEGKERKIIDRQGSDALEGLGVLIGAGVQNDWNFCKALRPGGVFYSNLVCARVCVWLFFRYRFRLGEIA